MASPKIIPKKSVQAAKIPLSSDLENGEICINHADKKLYAKHPGTGAIQEIGSLGAHSHDELYSLDNSQHIELQNNGTLIVSNGATYKTLTFPAATGTLATLADITGSGVSSVNTRTGAVTLTKSDVGLGNCDNTSDANKPVSTATQTALDGKEPTISTLPIAKGGTGATTAAAARTALGITSGIATDVQIFTSSGTWTKPTGAKSVHIVTIAGGGGGASGRVSAGTHGGGAGAGGGLTERTITASVLGSTEIITVGAGGTGGASQTVINSQNAVGLSGGNSSFGVWVIAGGGGGGGVTAYAGGASNRAMWVGIGGAGGGSNSAGGSGSISINAGAGGGGGAGTASDGSTQYDGGLGGAVLSNLLSGGQIVGGTAPGGNGANGTNFTSFVQGGAGGGGGASNSNGNGGRGGDGGTYGGGGGGGGACKFGFASGAGGAGAQGIVVVTTYF